MYGGNRVTKGEVFNKYFNLIDLSNLLEDNKLLVEVVSSEIVNSINVSSKNVSDGDEAHRLFQSEIQRSSTMFTFSKAFPELSQKLTSLIEAKSEIKQIEKNISVLKKEVNGDMKKNNGFR
jgi:hypothetical protein